MQDLAKSPKTENYLKYCHQMSDPAYIVYIKHGRDSNQILPNDKDQQLAASDNLVSI